MFDIGIGEKIADEFNWINDVPVAITISDAKTLEVVKCNDLFLGMFNLSELGKLKIKLNGIKAVSGVKSVVTLNVTGMIAHLFTSVKSFKVDGKEFLLSTHENLMHLVKTNGGFSDNLDKELVGENTQIIVVDKNMEYVFGKVYDKASGLKSLTRHMELTGENSRLTLAYFIIEGFCDGDFSETEAIDNALSIVKGGTRQTDILARMDKNDFILIFPNCAYEVVDSIMGTIEKKIEVFNETGGADYNISFIYAMAEYDARKKQSAEEFANSLRCELV